MAAPPSASGRFAWLVAGLIVAFLTQAALESHLKSPTSDEPLDIASGLSYVATGSFRANPEHPPLIKELSGLSLLAGGVRWPHNALTDSLRHDARTIYSPQPETEIGNRLIADNGPDRTLFWARLPMLLVAGMLGVLIYAWGRALVGPLAAACAVFVFVTDPTIIAHSYLVTNDVGLAAFLMLFLFTLWRYAANPTTARLIACGAALGAFLCTKFSAVLLLPAVPLLLLAARWHAPAEAEAGRTASTIRKTLALAVIAAIAVQATYFFSPDLLAYVHGAGMIRGRYSADAMTYLDGTLEHRFPHYFAAAFLLKEPLASIVLAGAGLVLLVRSRAIQWPAKLFLILPPAIMFAGPTLLADQLGIRYIMPVLPFAHLFAGFALAHMLSGAMRPRVVGTVLCAWLIVADAGIAPDHLSYFNEGACLLTKPKWLGVDGGTRCGIYWLDDSNVDWGQSLRQLKTWTDRTGEHRPFRYASVYGFPPGAYRLQSTPVAETELTGTPMRALYVISAAMVARLNGIDLASHWTDSVPPIAVVGHALYVYEAR